MNAFGSKQSIVIGLLVGSIAMADLGASWSCEARAPVLADDALLMIEAHEGMESTGKMALEQKQQQQLDQFLKMNSEEKHQIIMDIQQKSELGAAALEQSQWGFLKNIINIDKFFDSGADPGGMRGQKGAKPASMGQKKEKASAAEKPE